MKNSILFISILSTILFFSACEKDLPVPSDENIETKMNFTAKVDGEDLVFYEDNIDPRGFRYQIETFRFYLSKIVFTNTSNEEVEFEDVVLLKFRDAQTSSPVIPTSIVSKLPEGNYKKVSFNLGVDPERNSQDPAQYERDHPLSVFQGMHWSWNTGYIFYKLEGRVDEAPGGNGSLSKSVLYHLGLDELLKNIAFDINLEVNSQNNPELNIGVDINKIFASDTDTIQIESEGFSHTTESFELAERVINNTVEAFYLINE